MFYWEGALLFLLEEINKCMFLKKKKKEYFSYSKVYENKKCSSRPNVEIYLVEIVDNNIS